MTERQIGDAEGLIGGGMRPACVSLLMTTEINLTLRASNAGCPMSTRSRRPPPPSAHAPPPGTRASRALVPLSC